MYIYYYIFRFKNKNILVYRKYIQDKVFFFSVFILYCAILYDLLL